MTRHQQDIKSDNFLLKGQCSLSRPLAECVLETSRGALLPRGAFWPPPQVGGAWWVPSWPWVSLANVPFPSWPLPRPAKAKGSALGTRPVLRSPQEEGRVPERMRWEAAYQCLADLDGSSCSGSHCECLPACLQARVPPLLPHTAEASHRVRVPGC